MHVSRARAPTGSPQVPLPVAEPGGLDVGAERDPAHHLAGAGDREPRGQQAFSLREQGCEASGGLWRAREHAQRARV